MRTLPAKAGLPELAGEIRREVKAAENAWRDAVGHAIRAGELLIEAKSKVEHGGWLPWLRENFPGGETTARNYMRLARDRQRVADLPTVREAVAMLAAPAQDPKDKRLDPPIAFLFDCGTPVPAAYRRAMALMEDRQEKQEWIDRHEYLRPSGDDQSDEAQLRWLAFTAGGDSEAIRAGHEVHAEIIMIDREIRELLPADLDWEAVEQRSAALRKALEKRMGELS